MYYLSHLIRSKGLQHLGRRMLSIRRRYGVTVDHLAHAFKHLLDLLERYECQATFPVTAVILTRYPDFLCRLQEQGIELAVHGWTHVDLERCSAKRQQEHLSRALHIFKQHGISAEGFRSPYLRRNNTIREAVEALGFRYLSNQPVLWNMIDEFSWPEESRRAYQKAVDFYAPWSSFEHPSLPTMHGRTVEIPVALPDDEMLVERLGADSAQIEQIWLKILQRVYARGELFTIQFHPERAVVCAPALECVLSEAHSYNPPVWIARLDEIAKWWQQWQTLCIDVARQGRDQYNIAVRGPMETGMLVRSAHVIGESEVWGDGYQLVRAQRVSVRCNSRPVIGVSERSDKSLVGFLKQQGYAVEVSQENEGYSIYLDQSNFTNKDKKPLIQRIEGSDSPLIRISRWPGGARSALAITGDIDALTVWDYGLRMLGR